MLDNFSGNIITVTTNKQQIISYAEPITDAAPIGVAEEGFADVTRFKIYHFDIEKNSEFEGSLRSVNRFKSVVSFYVLYVSPAADLLDPTHASIASNVRALLSSTPIAPDLSEEDLDTLTAEVIREVNGSPERSHAFYAIPHETFDMLKSIEVVEYIMRNAMSLETSIISPLFS